MAEIKVKRAGSAGSTLNYGELAIGNNKLYFGNSSNIPIVLASESWVTSQGYVTSSGVTSVSGTTNQISVTNGTTTPTLSIPSTFIAPGSIQSTSNITVGSGVLSWDIDGSGSNFVFTKGSYTATLEEPTSNKTIAYREDPGTWELLRNRAYNASLSIAANGTTGYVISVTDTISQGDVLAIEVNTSNSIAAIPKIVIVTIGRISTAVATGDHSTVGFITASASDDYQYNTFGISASSNKIYFDNSYRLIINPGSTTALTSGTDIIYVGKIWRIK